MSDPRNDSGIRAACLLLKYLPKRKRNHLQSLGGDKHLSSGIWASVSGANARTQVVDTVANNLANVNTDGYKKDALAFQEYLSSAEREHDHPSVKYGQVTDKDLNYLGDQDTSQVLVNGTYTNFRQGPMKVTKSPMDLALEGPGMIEVSSPNGTLYTRLGSLKVAADGRVVTKEGYPVLLQRAGGITQNSPNLPDGIIPGSLSDPEVASRFVNIADRNTAITITQEGDVYSAQDLIGRLSVSEFQDSKKLFKVGGQYFRNTDPLNNPPITSVQTKVHQGMIEGSNVNPVEEMTNLIKAHRYLEADMKAIKTFSEMMGKEVNEIGKP